MICSESWEPKRAIRRHHRKRIIRKRYEKVKIGRWYVKSLGCLAKNNTVCSCWMCGIPRKYFGEITRQEKIFKSSAITDTWFDFARDCDYLNHEDHQILTERCSSVGKMLGSMLKNPDPFLLRLRPLRFRPLTSDL